MGDVYLPRPDRSGTVVADPATDQLRATEVSKHYGGLRALHEVSVELNRGEIVGLIGPNGSGKTTLLNCLSGSLRTTAGEVMVGGQRLTGRTPRKFAAAGVARTFQNISLFNALTVSENVEAGCVAGRSMSRAEGVVAAREELALVGIDGHADSFAENLAYGDRRRLEIARALATDPRFLLLDEPAAGMNDVESRDLGQYIHGVREDRGCGILMVDHDLRLIMNHCDRVYVLSEGELLASGTTDEVQRDPLVIAAYTGGESVVTDGMVGPAGQEKTKERGTS